MVSKPGSSSSLSDSLGNEWHLREASELLSLQAVDPARGLQDHQVTERTLTFGANVLPMAAKRSMLSLLLEQFSDFMILVLVVAALISGLLAEWVDAAAILVIVLLNAGIGMAQTMRADHALAALQRFARAHATVLRGGKLQQVAAEVLVPGDIVMLEAGNQVPADLRLLQCAQLKIDESALTGESVTMDKHSAMLEGASHALGDRFNMAFRGTLVTHGHASGLVVSTGRNTELGQIAGTLMLSGKRSTPLQLRLAAFGKQVAVVVLGICALIFALGVLRGEAPLLMMLTAISLAVAAIPEALPAVVTVLLALGARRLANLHALVRKLPSVETLGSVTYICSDKTGTLTQNRMQVHTIIAGGAAEVDHWLPGSVPADAGQGDLLRAVAMCNDATQAPDGTWRGDPTETALTEVAAVAGLRKSELDAESPRVMEYPFDSLRKRMTTIHKIGDAYVAYIKGAPEAVIPLCSGVWETCVAPSDLVSAEGIDAQAWLARADRLAVQGLRVLAVARRSLARLPAVGSPSQNVESELDFMGLVGLIDPSRPEALDAVRECVAAGITPVMITGDHPATALAIARELEIVSSAEAEVLTGTDLDALDDGTLAVRVQSVRVYARVDPAQKIRIVQALQSQGEFVAMTGDGVNDAPALTQADIGIAMGRNGTDVARESASLVLLDDNFATIVKAVREGRRIYDNIRKFVRYAMTGNSAEIWTIALAPMLMLPIPLLPIHILWINLVTDGLPGLALAAEPAERGIMRRPPRSPSEGLFARGMWQHILCVGLLLAALCLGVQAWALSTGHAHWQSMVFTVLTLGQMAHVLAIRSEAEPLWRLGLWSNRPLLGAVVLTFVLQMATLYVPVLNPVFKTQPLSMFELLVCLGAAGLVGAAVELEKAWRRHRLHAKSIPATKTV